MTQGADHPLIAYLRRGAICIGVEGEGEEVIRLLAGRLLDRGCVDEGFADAVVARERTMPTGLPLGHSVNVAIPHADPKHVRVPALALATLKRPVAFRNMEDPDEPVDVGLVFLMALNDKDRQIEMLQAVIGAVQDAGMIERLRAARSETEIEAALMSGGAGR